MRPLSIVKKGDLRRALDAAKSVGLEVDSYRVLPDGEIVVKVRIGASATGPLETPETILRLV